MKMRPSLWTSVRLASRHILRPDPIRLRRDAEDAAERYVGYVEPPLAVEGRAFKEGIDLPAALFASHHAVRRGRRNLSGNRVKTVVSIRRGGGK